MGAATLLGALCTGGACKEGLQDPARAAPTAVGRHELLVVGRIHVRVLGEDRSGATLFRTNARPDELMIPDDGLVTWLLPRLNIAARLVAFTGPGLDRTGQQGYTKYFFFSNGPLLSVDRPPVPIVYFGTITIRLEEGGLEHRVGLPGRIGVDQTDEAEETFRELVRINPAFAGVQYFHAMRGRVVRAGSERSAAYTHDPAGAELGATRQLWSAAAAPN